MNPQADYPPHNPRRPDREVAEYEWRDTEGAIAHKGHEPTVPGYPQTGTRTPPEQCADTPEPPENPPMPTQPTYSTKPAETYPTRPKPASPYPAHPHPMPERPAQESGHEHGEHEHGAGTGAAATTTVTSSAPRQNQRSLTPTARTELHRRLRDYIQSPADPVAYHRANGHVHGTPQFLPWHRQFLQSFERWQRERLAHPSAFIPLAFWDPADPLPAEFPTESWNRPRTPSIASMPLPQSLSVSGLATLDYASFAAALEAHHNLVHGAIGGDMLDPRISPGDTCFWLFHAFIDNVFAEWEAMRERP